MLSYCRGLYFSIRIILLLLFWYLIFCEGIVTEAQILFRSLYFSAIADKYKDSQTIFGVHSV